MGSLNNKVVMASFLSWFVAQSLKIIIEYIKYRKLDFSKMISSGGMPSSHSALVTSMSTAVGLIDGFGSTTFAISLGLACIVMYDAAGVRLAVGKQAKILNQILEDVQNHHFEAEKLKELIGHTPIQVFFGGILGIVLTIILI